MKVDKAFLCTLVLLGTVYVVRSAVSGTACTGGGNECDSIANAECDSSNCKCSDGFVEKVDRCDAIIADGDCSADPTACNAITNAECDGTACICAKTYVANKGKTPGTCDKKGLDAQCSDDDDCKHVVNSACSSAECKCSTGYFKNGAVCDAVVSGTSCSVAGKPCDAIGHATCVSTNCKCDAGYKEKNNKCDAIFGSACNKTADCGSLENANCTNKKCGCATDYAGKNDLCVKVVSAMICSDGGTECDSIENAECDVTKKRCKCGDGFVENANACETKSGAVSVTSAIGLVFGSLIMLLM